MKDKSYVAMEAKVCPVCTQQHQHDCGILLDRRLKETFDAYKPTVTGWGLCEKCSNMMKEYYAIIVCDRDKSDTTTLSGVYRTGEYLWIKQTAWDKVFTDQPVPPKGLCFMDYRDAVKLKAVIPENQS